MALGTQELHELAKRGATIRLAELEQETSVVRSVLKDIEGLQKGASMGIWKGGIGTDQPRRGRPRGRKRAHATAAPAAAPQKSEVEAPPPAKKRVISAKGRKAISRAMKRRWAEKRAATPSS